MTIFLNIFLGAFLNKNFLPPRQCQSHLTENALTADSADSTDGKSIELLNKEIAKIAKQNDEGMIGILCDLRGLLFNTVLSVSSVVVLVLFQATLLRVVHGEAAPKSVDREYSYIAADWKTANAESDFS